MSNSSTGTPFRRTLTRRTLLQNLAGTAALAAVPIPKIFAQRQYGGSTGQQRGEMGRLAGQFRRQFRVPATSIAISRNGQFAYDETVGMADPQHVLQAQQSSLFRIASATKPITSVTIFSLIEQGKLNLTDKVFGPSGILDIKYGKPPYKPYITDITVDHLLTHTSGGWPNDNTDPMMHNDGWDHIKLITETIANVPLTYPPGTHWAYSNFGYCILGRVIEQVTGQPYEGYVQTNILAPCGITTMQIAKNSERERAPNEVVYVGQYSEDPYKLNVTRMDSHGGWIASSTDLVQFLNHVAGAPGIPALLKPATIKMMTTPAPAYPPGDARYARGWMVRNNGAGNWWHNGSLPGTTSIMVRTPTGFCWAALCNTRSQPSDEIDTAIDQMMWNMVRTVPSWNA
ncbi:serine hydrolase [Granulicella sp. L56]|uniref:serine hydrolase domain-containing protein n=3 Tax=Acidobacteriaceae TaxID=204434 RepID=UPI00131D0067|nr:serine hydrolase domain-containing protein [Granulicella sp. L56]